MKAKFKVHAYNTVKSPLSQLINQTYDMMKNL